MIGIRKCLVNGWTFNGQDKAPRNSFYLFLPPLERIFLKLQTFSSEDYTSNADYCDAIIQKKCVVKQGRNIVYMKVE
jgi:hypothetical protein